MTSASILTRKLEGDAVRRNDCEQGASLRDLACWRLADMHLRFIAALSKWPRGIKREASEAMTRWCLLDLAG